MAGADDEARSVVAGIGDLPALLKRTRHGLASLTDPMSGHGKGEIEPLMLKYRL